MYCKGICSKHAVKKPHTVDAGRYESGHKRCSICEIYIIWDGEHCPSCGCSLKAKLRDAQARSRLVQNSNEKKYS